MYESDEDRGFVRVHGADLECGGYGSGHDPGDGFERHGERVGGWCADGEHPLEHGPRLLRTRDVYGRFGCRYVGEPVSRRDGVFGAVWCEHHDEVVFAL